MVEELAEEAAKTRLFPGVGFRGTPRRAWVIGSGLDVWRSWSCSAPTMETKQPSSRATPSSGERHLRLARAYAERFPEEVEAMLAQQRRSLGDLVALYPFLEVTE